MAMACNRSERARFQPHRMSAWDALEEATSLHTHFSLGGVYSVVYGKQRAENGTRYQQQSQTHQSAPENFLLVQAAGS
jgi:hypothetical protein